MVQMKRRWAFKKINIHVNVTCHGTLDVPISDYRVSDSGHVIENLETHQCFVMFNHRSIPAGEAARDRIWLAIFMGLSRQWS